MKALKFIAIIIVSIIVLFMLIALFLPNEFIMERSIIIQAPVNSVFLYISNLNNRKEWDPWLEIEPEAQSIVFGEGAGARWEWQGDVIGKGRLTINKIIPNKLISSHITFLAPQEGEADITWQFESSTNAVKITWGFQMPLTYPFNRYGSLFMEKYLAPSYQRGLVKIKKIMETQHLLPTILE